MTCTQNQTSTTSNLQETPRSFAPRESDVPSAEILASGIHFIGAELMLLLTILSDFTVHTAAANVTEEKKKRCSTKMRNNQRCDDSTDTAET